MTSAILPQSNESFSTQLNPHSFMSHQLTKPFKTTSSTSSIFQNKTTMETFTESNELLTVVGPKDINFRSSGIKLEERWKGEEGAKRVEEISDHYAMGQSLKLNSVPKIVDYLAIRDYSELYNYNGKKRLGAIFVPDSYNPVKPDMVYVDKFDKVPKERTKKDFTDAVGDMAERSVYEVLKATFTHKKFKGSVLVIQGLEMLAIDPKKRQCKQPREMDFLISSSKLQSDRLSLSTKLV